MITGIQDIYYNVSDKDRAVQFYTKVIGMKVRFSEEHWTSLDAWGTNIGLHWTEGQPVPHSPRDSHGAHSGATLTLKSNDVTMDKEKLIQAGATILGEMDAAWGHMLIFEDLDGNVLKLMNPKY